MLARDYKFVIIFVICLVGYASAAPAHNETTEIKVISYSQWYNNLPKFELPFINNYIYNNLGIPRELSVVMESLGFASLIIFIAVFLVIFVIGYAFASICLWGKLKQDPCQKISGRILAILILISMIVCCSIGIFFFSRYYNTVWQGIDNVKTVVYEKREMCEDIKSISASFNKSEINFTIPTIVSYIENGTYIFDGYLSNTESEKVRALEQWGPVTMFVIIMLISIAGLMAVFFSKRVMFFIIALFIGIMFIFLIVSAVSGSVVSILLSDYCVGGVDNLTRLAINVMIDEKCSEDAFRYYLFCYWENNTCNSLYGFSDEIQYKILEIQQKINSYNSSEEGHNVNQTIYWKEQQRLLREMSFRVSELSSCSQTQKLYLHTTNLFCGQSTPSIIMFANTLELMVGLIFIFLLVVIRFNPSVHFTQDDVDIELEKKETRRTGLRPRKGLKKEAPVVPPKVCTLQCLGGFVSMIIGWAIVVFVFFLLMSVGSSEIYVSRVKIIETY